MAVAIDPVDPKRILAKLNEIERDVKLTHLLLTHKHWDHAGGNKFLIQQFPDLVVVGSAQDFPENGLLNFKKYLLGINKRVVDQETFMVSIVGHGLGREITI